MSKQLVEAAQRIPGDDGGVTAFHQGWRTLIRRVRRRFWWLDRERIEDAVADTILHHLAQDGRDAGGAWEGTGKLCLCSLYCEACRNVGNSVRMDKRRCRREQEYARRKKVWSIEDFSGQNGLSAENTFIGEQWEVLEQLLQGCRAWERTFVALRKQGVKYLTVYAEVLGVDLQPLEEQRRAVNRAWNRIRMKLQRLKESGAHATDPEV
jgi:hypothetical protein